MNKEALLEKLRAGGFSEEIIDAFSTIEREKFVPDNLVAYSYEDIPLPLEDGSTTSQPSTIAFMISLLEPKEGNKILEIGSGSGFVLALLSKIITKGNIYGLEINRNLAVKSRRTLEDDKNVQIINRSGSSGLPDFAPYDRILISASFEDKNTIAKILNQLNDPGVMVVPVKNSIYQIKKEKGKVTEKEFPGFVFVPFRE